MSINSWTERDAIEIRREAVSSGSGEAIKTWTTAARGALPALAVKCRIQELDGEEATTYGVRAGIRSWKLYFGASGDPSITVSDRVFLRNEDGVLQEALVIRGSKSFDHQGRLWKVIVEELGYAE